MLGYLLDWQFLKPVQCQNSSFYISHFATIYVLALYMI